MKSRNSAVILKEKERFYHDLNLFWNISKFNLYALERNFESKKYKYSAKFYPRVLNNNLFEIYKLGVIFIQDNIIIYTERKMRQ